MVDIDTPLSKSQLRKFHFIGKLQELQDELGDRQISMKLLRDNAEAWGLEPAAFSADLEFFKSQGWVDFFASLAGINEVILRQPGIDAGGSFNTSRKDPRRRSKAVRANLLEWLYDCHHSGDEYPVIDRFSSSRFGNYLGLVFAEAEVVRGLSWLKDFGFIKGDAASGGVIPRPGITNTGIERVENEVDPQVAQSAIGGNIHVHVRDSHSVNVAVGSSDISQSNTLTAQQLKSATDFVQAFRELMPVLGLSDEVKTRADEVLGEIAEEAQAIAPTQGRMKELLYRAVETVTLGTASGAVQALLAMAQNAITAVGG